MTEHEKLKYICDKIGYEVNFYKTVLQKDLLGAKTINKSWKYGVEDVEGVEFLIDVREIIFSQEFMDKYFKYYKENAKYNNIALIRAMKLDLFDKLDNPVDFLFNKMK